jgi:hypothetical protein
VSLKGAHFVFIYNIQPKGTLSLWCKSNSKPNLGSYSVKRKREALLDIILLSSYKSTQVVIDKIELFLSDLKATLGREY